MNVTVRQLEKIELFYGLSRDVLKALNYWIDLNPSDSFDVDEFIDLLEQKKQFSNIF